MAPLHLRPLTAPLLRLALLCLFAVGLPAAIPPTPPPGDFLHDFAGLLTAEQQAGIRDQQQQIFHDTQIPIVVVTVAGMRNYLPGAPSIEAFARFWFDTWGIGSQRQNAGILVIVSRDDRRARIELGASWGRRWDNYAQAVMNDRMVPRFKTGDYGAGLIAGTEALARMAVAGPGSEPPAPNALEKFMATPFVKFARENNPLTEKLGKWTPLALAAGVILAVIGLFVPEHRKTLLSLGLGIVGLILLFWVAAAVIALVNGKSSGSSGSFSDGGGALAAVRPAAAAPREAGKMKNAQQILSPAEHERVQARIAQLETRTDSEVVCAVATESGRYDRAESLCGLTAALVALLSIEKFLSIGAWDRSSGLSLGAQTLTIVLGFTAGSVLASYWHGLRRLFTGAREIDAELRRSVNQVFAQRGIGETRQRGGVLIYLSLFERRVEIRCDRALASTLPPATLLAIRDAILARLKTGDLVSGLIAGLDEAEAALAKAMPATGTPTEQLPNTVLIFHPRPA